MTQIAGLAYRPRLGCVRVVPTADEGELGEPGRRGAGSWAAPSEAPHPLPGEGPTEATESASFVVFLSIS